MSLSEFLQTAPEFSGMSASDIATLDRIMVLKDYPDGHVFFSDDDTYAGALEQ